MFDNWHCRIICKMNRGIFDSKIVELDRDSNLEPKKSFV